MFRSIRLGRLWGIDVFVHSTFVLFLLYFGYQEWGETQRQGFSDRDSFHSACNMVALICAIFGCVVLHEYGHALTARKFGIGTVDITLYPIGGVARLERIPENPRQELLVAIAGPAVNLGIVLILLAAFGLTKFLDVERLAENRGDLMHKLMVWGDFWKQLMLANVVMIVFNAIPAFPMDGGRVLRSLLAMKIDRVKATDIAAGIGKVLAIALGIYGIYSQHYLLAFTGWFVWLGASQEARAVRQQSVTYLEPTNPTTWNS